MRSIFRNLSSPLPRRLGIPAKQFRAAVSSHFVAPRSRPRRESLSLSNSGFYQSLPAISRLRREGHPRAVSTPEIGILLEPPDTGDVLACSSGRFPTVPNPPIDDPHRLELKEEERRIGRANRRCRRRGPSCLVGRLISPPGVLLYGNRTPLRRHPPPVRSRLSVSHIDYLVTVRCFAAWRVASHRVALSRVTSSRVESRSVAARANGVVCRVRGSRPMAEGHCC